MANKKKQNEEEAKTIQNRKAALRHLQREIFGSVNSNFKGPMLQATEIVLNEQNMIKNKQRQGETGQQDGLLPDSF